MTTRRGTTAQRGYAGAHARLRAQWKPVIDAGGGWCAETVCLEPTRWIPPGTPWHLAHAEDRSSWLGPAHERCNIAEVNRRRGNRMRRTRWTTSRQW